MAESEKKKINNDGVHFVFIILSTKTKWRRDIWDEIKMAKPRVLRNHSWTKGGSEQMGGVPHVNSLLTESCILECRPQAMRKENSSIFRSKACFEAQMTSETTREIHCSLQQPAGHYPLEATGIAESSRDQALPARSGLTGRSECLTSARHRLSLVNPIKLYKLSD